MKICVLAIVLVLSGCAGLAKRIVLSQNTRGVCTVTDRIEGYC